MHTFYVEWTIHCKRNTCVHHSDPIRLLPATPLPQSAAPVRSATDNTVLVFQCPACKLVFDYTESDVHQNPSLLGSRIPESDIRLLVWSDFECGQENCSTRVRLCAPILPSETPKEAADRLQSGEFDVKCASGHQVVFPADLGQRAKFPAGPYALLFD
jgi:hypothetical protein